MSEFEDSGFSNDNDEIDSEFDELDDAIDDDIVNDELLKLDELDLDKNPDFDPFYNDFIEFEEMTELSNAKLNFYKIKKSEDRKTKPFINKYEFTKLLGIRTEQITNGAQILLSNEKIQECKRKPLLLAMKEMEDKTFPLILKRRYVDKKGDYTYEEWKIEEFENIYQMILYFNYDI
jgi:DNA-directed RNA polymerase subunit K/omega